MTAGRRHEQQPRVPYAQAGEAMREMIARANRANPQLGARQRAVLDAVLVLTASYSKLQDTTTAREVAELAYGRAAVDGRDRERAREALNQLAQRGFIELTQISRGRHSRLIIAIPPASTGDGSDTTPTGVGGVGGASTSSTPPVIGSNTPLDGSPTPPVSAAHLEDLEGNRGSTSISSEKSNQVASDLDRRAKSSPSRGMPRETYNGAPLGYFDRKERA